MDDKIVARCYMRVSTEEQAQSGYSMAGQRDKLDLFAQLQGYVVGGWYRDDGVSAKDLNRPEFQRMMAEAQRGDVIVVYKLDRLTRSVRDLDELLREMEKRGLHFRSVTEQFDTTTATGRLMIRMVGEFAQWERETIAERTAFGKQKKLAAGEWGGGRPPFGYRLVPSDRVKGGRTLMKLEPDPDAAPLVSSIFERYLRGHGLRSLSTWLNESLGARSALGRKFDSVKVARILQNPMYLGVLNSRDGLIPSSHEALIAQEIFDKVQETFDLRKQMAPRQATGAFVLSGVARCGVCGGVICVGKAGPRSRQAGQYWYRCRNYTFARGCGGKGKALTSAPGPAMEDLLVQKIVRLGIPETLDEFYRAIEEDYERRLGMSTSEISAVHGEIAEAEKAIQRWDALYETGRLEMEDYLKRVQPHQERLRVLRDRLAEAQKEPAPPPKEVLAQFLVTFPDIWAEADPHERKALLQHFVNAWGVTVYLYPGQRLELVPAHRPADEPASAGLGG
ncbi:MAG TPA: recombinase family protein [Symbiobacteriaceae bacterium]|nr:recombinase family protein [Symbiobacteriaceae bacterium]